MQQDEHNLGDHAASEFLQKLVATPSVSGSEQAAAELFRSKAAELGLTAAIDAAGNAIATSQHQNATEPTDIVLLGHIDTVPGDIPVRVEDGILHGRGAVDAKGPLAAMLFAAARVTPPPGIRLVVIAAVGEETSESPGARHIVDRDSPAACIIGEPSNWDAVTLGYKGRLLIEYTLDRPCGHSAAADGSPADAALAWWAKVRRWAELHNGANTAAFETIQCTVLDLHTESDGLTDRVRLVGSLRLPPAMPPILAAEQLDQIDRADASVTIRSGEIAHRTTRDDPVVTALSAAIRAHGARPRHKLKTGTADLNVVAPVWNCPIAAYGPGDSTLDHSPEERIDLAEFTRSISVLEHAINALAHQFSTSCDCCGRTE